MQLNKYLSFCEIKVRAFDKARYREFWDSAFLISSLSGETRNSVGKVRLADPVRRVSG